MSEKTPKHQPNESPTDYADGVGEWYAGQTSIDHKSEHGQYLTPPIVARFMAGRFKEGLKGGTLRILDPGAGAGTLSCAVLEAVTEWKKRPERVELVVYETEKGLLKPLDKVLSYARAWLSERGVELTFTIHATDFILDNAPGHPSFFLIQERPALFDLIISNPPYFKIQKEDARAAVCSFVVHGQPNIYALFMAVSARLLKEHGELVFITPRSFAAGPYFRLFRERFFEMIRPERIHLFGSRTDSFKRDEVLQESVILTGTREIWQERAETFNVEVTLSAGARDVMTPTIRTVPMSEVINVKSRNVFMHIPASDEEQKIINLVNSWTDTLHSHGMEISTGPVVPFRAIGFITNENGHGEVPLLWMQNVKALETTWPVPTRKQQYIACNDDSAYLLLPVKNYVLLRRFSAKEEHRRLTAAPFISSDFQRFRLVGFENHLNYIYRPGQDKTDQGMTENEAYGIAAILNCRLLDTFFRSFNGNTQVSATELRSIPLPAIETIRSIGKEARTGRLTNGELDAWISDSLMKPARPVMKSIKSTKERTRGQTRRSPGDSTGVRHAASAAK